MATLMLWAVMVTPDEVEDLAAMVRALGHEVTIGEPVWAGSVTHEDRVLMWLGTRLKMSEIREIAATTGEWARSQWTDRWRPWQLGYVNTRGREYPIDFLD